MRLATATVLVSTVAVASRITLLLFKLLLVIYLNALLSSRFLCLRAPPCQVGAIDCTAVMQHDAAVGSGLVLFTHRDPPPMHCPVL
jgi:hypothetical protein